MTIFIVNCHYSGDLQYCKFRMMNGCWNISQFKRSLCTWISSIHRSSSNVSAITCDHAIVIQIANAWPAQPTMHHEQWIFGFGIVRFGLFLNRQNAWSRLSHTDWPSKQPMIANEIVRVLEMMVIKQSCVLYFYYKWSDASLLKAQICKSPLLTACYCESSLTNFCTLRYFFMRTLEKTYHLGTVIAYCARDL